MPVIRRCAMPVACRRVCPGGARCHVARCHTVPRPSVVKHGQLPQRRVLEAANLDPSCATMAQRVRHGLAHHGEKASPHVCGHVFTGDLDRHSYARAAHDGVGCLMGLKPKVKRIVVEVMHARTDKREGLVHGAADALEVCCRGGIRLVDDCQCIRLELGARELVANAVVDLAGDAGTLGEGRLLHLVVLSLEEVAVFCLQQ